MIYNYLSEEDEEVAILWSICSLNKLDFNSHQLKDWKKREEDFYELF